MLAVDWISVADSARRPGDRAEVLVYYDPRSRGEYGAGCEPCIGLATYHNDVDGCGFVSYDDPFWGDYVTYWMPLPGVPGEDG